MNIAAVIANLRAQFQDIGKPEFFVRFISTIVMVALIVGFFRLIEVSVRRLLKGRITDQQDFIIKKVFKYISFMLAILFVFKALNIDTSVLLGAAGLFSVLIGFAVQTSVASFIAGFFLLSEKPFEVGDTIQIDTVLGTVLSVDLLSVKVRTFDNLYVRIPNESLIKSNLVTLSRFPCRRLDLVFCVTYRDDLDKIKKLCLETATANQFVLKDPPPLFRVDKFDKSGITIIFNVWHDKAALLDTKTSMYMELKARFDAEHIELPYQKVDITMQGTERERA